MKKKAGIILGFVASFTLYAQKPSNHVDKIWNFSLQYPANWGKESNKQISEGPQVQFVATAPDGAAQIQVLVQELETMVTATEFLTQMEQVLGGYSNLLPEPNRNVSKAQKKAVKADDIALGAYKIEGDGPGFPVLSGISVYIRKNRVYILIQTIQQRQKEAYLKPVSDSVQSFKILK